MKIDISAHILPPKYRDALQKLGRGGTYRVEASPTNVNLEDRFRIMDKYGDLLQVLTLSASPPEAIADSKEAVDLAIQGNKKIYELQKDALRTKYLRPKSENSEVNDK